MLNITPTPENARRILANYVESVTMMDIDDLPDSCALANAQDEIFIILDEGDSDGDDPREIRATVKEYLETNEDLEMEPLFMG